MIIRISKEEELETITNISMDAFFSDVLVGGTPNDGPNGFDSLTWHKGVLMKNRLYSIILDDKLIGGIIIFIKPDKGLHLGRIFIDPKYHYQGYGLKAMELLESLFIDTPYIDLATPIWNKRTNNFYKKLGYTYVGNDGESNLYRKDLK